MNRCNTETRSYDRSDRERNTIVNGGSVNRGGRKWKGSCDNDTIALMKKKQLCTRFCFVVSVFLFYFMNVRERDRLGLIPCKIMELLVLLITEWNVYIQV